MSLSDQIARIRLSIQAGQYVNEAAVCTGVVLPTLHALGWPIFDPQVVAPEYTIEGRRVDYALCHPRNKPLVFIEVKQPGRSEGADRQLFEYAFHLGVPMAVLTDGREWHIYLPAEQGHYQDRRVYKLDIVERSPEEAEQRLQTYLEYSRVTSGEALSSARDDYAGLRRGREIASTIPVAWRTVLEKQDELLVELVADQVESLCGYKPDPDLISEFLLSQLKRGHGAVEEKLSPAAQPGMQRAHTNRGTRAPTTAPRPTSLTASAVSALGFSLDGARTVTRNARETLIRFFEEMNRRDSTFLERFAALPKHGRSRRFLARSREELYPGRDDLARDYSHEVAPGWWLGTNYGSIQIRKIIDMARDVAGLNPRQVEVNL
jgi:hypothetical protein